MTASHQKPAKHGRDHLPGGEDPIQATTGTGLATAIARQFLTSGNNNTALKFSDIAWNNNALFGYDSVSGTPKTARYVTANQDGTYLLHCNVFWDSDFTVGDNPFILPLIWLPATSLENSLINTLGLDEVDDTQNIIYGEQLTTAELDHHQVVANFTFGLHLSSFPGNTRIGFGVKLSSSITRSKSYGGGLALTRLGDAPVAQTIV